MSRFIFNENGEMFIINNLENYLVLQLDEDIVKTLENNLYWHYLNNMVEDLVKEGLAKRFGEPYNYEDIELTINEIKLFMVENYGFNSEKFKTIDIKIKKLLPKK